MHTCRFLNNFYYDKYLGCLCSSNRSELGHLEGNGNHTEYGGTPTPEDPAPCSSRPAIKSLYRAANVCLADSSAHTRSQSLPQRKVVPA